jgi:ribose transport system ATP-binding protein
MPLALLVVLMLAIGGYTTARAPDFLTSYNVNGLLVAVVPLALLSMGQLNALLVGSFDVSVGGLVTLGVVVGSFTLADGESWYALLGGAVAIVAIGFGVGVCNALLIKVIGISAIIATLATLSVLQGLSLALRPVPAGAIDLDFVDALTRSWGFMPISFVGVAVLALLGDYWLYRTRGGLAMRAVGLDDVSARRLGWPSRRVQVAAFVACSALAALGALFLAAQVAIGDPRIGLNDTLPSIAAPIVGGASFAGGRGSFVGAVFGALFFYLIVNILPFLGVSAGYGQISIGALTIVALVVYQGPALLAALRAQIAATRPGAAGS